MLTADRTASNMLQKLVPYIRCQFFVPTASGMNKMALIYGFEINNGRRPRRSSFHPIVIITEFNTKQKSILQSEIY